MKHTKTIFSKVLTIGPSRKALAGIASVLNIYSDTLPDFRHLPTNSTHGFIPGVFTLAKTFMLMPIERIRGRRILHVHAASGKSFIRKRFIMQWGRLLGYKIVYHCHGGNSREYFNTIGNERVGKLLNRCAAIIALSKSWQDYFTSTFNHSNVYIVPNPLIPTPKVLSRKESSPLKLLFLGNIVEAKGIFDLLQVIADNRQRWHGRIKLTIGGNGENERLMDFINSNKIDGMVDFAGWVNGDQKEALFTENHILILPSYIECLPMTIIEAMGHGLAVISTSVGGIPEMVLPGENGILFKPGDRKAMSAAIDCYLLNNELISRHGNGGLRLAPRFFPEEIKRTLFEIYSSILTND